MLKSTRRWIASGIFALLTALLVAAANLLPEFFFSFYPALSRRMLAVLAAVTSPVPFAVWEWLALGLAVWAVVSLVRAIRRRRLLTWLSGLVMGGCMGVFLFVGLWGLNHFAPPINETMDFAVTESTTQQLQAATEYYLTVANDLSGQVPRDENHLFAPPAFDELAQSAGDGYRILAEQYDLFDGSTVRVKKLASSWLFGKMSLTGIFVDFTGESCVSTTTYGNGLPFTMCHEIGHRMGVAAEDEANFAAFLACDANPSVSFRYSGYYEAFVYCYSALYKADPAAAAEVWAQAGELVAADYAGAYRHYQAVVSETATKVSDAVNDTYLKVFAEQSGVQSYGEVADLLIAWYQLQP